MTESNKSVTVITIVNDDEVLNNNLLHSPELQKGGHQIIIKRGYSSATQAYNEGIATAENDIILCIHQDVYLPDCWISCLQDIIASIETIDPFWGVMGCFGITDKGEHAGHVYSNGLQSFLRKGQCPTKAQSLDEMVLILKKGSGINFDGHLPNYHMYGADICARAHRLGLSAYIIDNFCIHNSVTIRKFKNDFWEAMEHFRNQYPDLLPIKTTCTTVHKSSFDMKKQILRMKFQNIFILTKDHIKQVLLGEKSRYITMRNAEPWRIMVK